MSWRDVKLPTLDEYGAKSDKVSRSLETRSPFSPYSPERQSQESNNQTRKTSEAPISKNGDYGENVNQRQDAGLAQNLFTGLGSRIICKNKITRNE